MPRENIIDTMIQHGGYSWRSVQDVRRGSAGREGFPEEAALS